MSFPQTHDAKRPHAFSRGKQFLNRFNRDEDGAMLIFGVYVLLIILMVGGIGVDLMRFERDRTNLQYTLDRAVLAAADLEQPLEPTAVVNDYFAKAGLLQYLTSVHVTGDKFHRKVSGSVSMDIQTQFMRMTGTEILTAVVSAAAIEQVPNVEISLVLDISGSMKTNDRVTLMKTAAKSFTSTALARNTDSETGTSSPFQTSVSVVPFSGQTNPGATMFEYLGGERIGTTTASNYFPEWQQDTSNVTFRFDLSGGPDGGPDGIIDYSVKIEGFPDNDVEMFNKDDLDTYYKYAIEYIAQVSTEITLTDSGMVDSGMVGATIKGGQQPTSFYNMEEDYLGDDILGNPDETGPAEFNNVDLTIDFFEFYNSLVPNNISSCLEMTYQDFMSTGLPTGSIEQVPYFVNWDYDEATQDWGWCPEDSMSIQYAQNDVDALTTFIDNLRLFDGTGTNYGMKYALALLDPNTQPAFAHLAANGEVPSEFQNRPLAWDTGDTSKYIVLLTDGRTGIQIRPTDTLDPDNTDTELTDRPASESTTESSSWTNLQMFHHQCELAKSMGVTIYTVALETSYLASAEVKQCASSPSHFFEVTGTEIIETFVSIASSIQKLRLYE
jgi:Flp pilus assembly protein TadG